jgi:hypothetical protein
MKLKFVCISKHHTNFSLFSQIYALGGEIILIVGLLVQMVMSCNCVTTSESYRTEPLLEACSLLDIHTDPEY